MLYFSELKGKKIITGDQVIVGRLDDLIFLAADHPSITKLVIEDIKKNKLIVPIEYLEKINSSMILRKDYLTGELKEDELFLMRNLLDKQIIDLKGNKIVRVNDIAIQDKNGLYVGGVDIGILGILRWLKLENTYHKISQILNFQPASNFLSWSEIQPLELTHGKVKLKKEEKRLEKLRPEDLADHLEKTNIINVRKILRILDEKFAADVITNLNINYQIALFRNFSRDKAAKVIALIDPDEAVDVLLSLPSKKREEIIFTLPPEKKRKINYLLSLAKTPIGDFVTTDYITVFPEFSAKAVTEKIKNEAADFNVLNYVYVVNKDRQLIGVFNLYELISQNSNNQVYKFMTQNVIVIHLTTPKEIVVKKMLKYRIYSLPVTDKNKQLLGIISLDDIAEAIIPKIS